MVGSPSSAMLFSHQGLGLQVLRHGGAAEDLASRREAQRQALGTWGLGSRWGWVKADGPMIG